MSNSSKKECKHSRADGREGALSVLYQIEVGKVDYFKAIDHIFEEYWYAPEVAVFLEELVDGIQKESKKIDRWIKSHLSKGWDFDRLGMIDLCILRIGFYELMFQKDTPHQIAVNEAVNLAKKYSAKESGKFINGVLGGFLKTLAENSLSEQE